MLGSYDTEWDAIWSLTTGLRTGVPVKGLEPDLPTQLSALKMQVTSYQQLAAAYDKATDDGLRRQLADKLAKAFAAIDRSRTALLDAIAPQIAANTAAKPGVMQLKDTTPAALCNPSLVSLSEQIHAVVGAMAIDQLQLPGGDDPPAPEGATVVVDAPSETLAPPDWLER